MFGRKGLQAKPSPAAPDGRAWIDAQLAQYDRPGSLNHAQALGHSLFDRCYHAMKDDRGVNIEMIVGMLSSVAGHLCLTSVLDLLSAEGRQPEDIGMVVMRGDDGHRYFFGDAPNRILCESAESFISLVFGAAHQHGGRVSIEMLHDEMRNVAGRAGKPDFLDLDLPSHLHVDSPLTCAQKCTHFVVNASGNGVPAPMLMMPTVIGFAVQQAIDAGHQALDPTILARIALVCSIRAAKLDPERVNGA